MDKPILLLDVDGVINAVNDKIPHVWPQDEWVQGKAQAPDGTRWKILTARPVVQFFTGLNRMGVADIRWHTTWQEGAHNVATLVGLPTFHIQPAQPNGEPLTRGYAWKTVAVNWLAEHGHRVMWVDDEARGAWAWRIVRPSSHTGLCRSDLCRIAEDLGTSYEEVIDVGTSQP